MDDPPLRAAVLLPRRRSGDTLPVRTDVDVPAVSECLRRNSVASRACKLEDDDNPTRRAFSSVFVVVPIRRGSVMTEETTVLPDATVAVVAFDTDTSV